MTISKGSEWGQVVPRPDDLVLVADDSTLCAALTGPHPRSAAPTGGDLHRTVGGRDITGRSEVLRLPIDLLLVTTDDDVYRACAHVQLRLPTVRGGWWRGPMLMVMNAEFIGDWQVVARGHPNDGRAESCEWGSDFGVRSRIEARRRLRTAAHVPHPLIRTATFRQRSWSFETPLDVFIDGRRVGRTRSLDVAVEPDAAIIFA